MAVYHFTLSVCHQGCLILVDRDLVGTVPGAVLCRLQLSVCFCMRCAARLLNVDIHLLGHEFIHFFLACMNFWHVLTGSFLTVW